MAATIYYDGECPFCTRYTDLVRLRDAVGPVELVNVREAPEALAMLEAEGFDLDAGMVFDHDGRRYGGADAVHQIALLTAEGGWFSRLTRAAFSSRAASALLYPVLRAGRAATLLAMGRQRIRPPAEGSAALFAIFSHAWGLFAVLHVLYYVYYEGATHVYPTTWLMGAFGAFLMARPASPRAFTALALVMAVDGWLQMPVHSNHTALRNFVLLAMGGAAAYTWARGRSWTAFMASFAPVGRAMLAVMYVFGVFHKINADFLNPAVSCAVALWETMPQPLPQLDALWFKYAAIYGTLVIETLILIGLLTKRLRHWAIITGIAFHGLLALSGFGFYPSFTVLSICLHLLFLSPEAAGRIVASPAWQRPMAFLRTARGVLALAAWLGLLYLLTYLANTSTLGVAWWPWAAWIMALVYLHGRERAGEATAGPPMWSRTVVLNLLTLGFFLNCAAPYFGLKNAQSMNMFANLVHEGGRSNHLIFRSAPGPIGYLNDVVRVTSASGSEYLSYAADHGWYVTYYDLLNQLERSPGARVTFVRDGKTTLDATLATVSAEAERTLHPRWVRNWLLFRPIELKDGKGCHLSQ